MRGKSSVSVLRISDSSILPHRLFQRLYYFFEVRKRDFSRSVRGCLVNQVKLAADIQRGK